MQTISVVIPARDEAHRIAPLLAAVIGAPGVDEVIVVDDQSSDDTADLARRAGATVLVGAPLPDGLGRQGLGVAPGHRRRHVGLGRDARRRRPAGPPAADGARGESGRRATRPAHRGGTVRVPDAREPLAAPGDADDARVPVRPARRRALSTRPHDGERSVHGARPGAVPVLGRHGTGRGEVVEDLALARRLAGDGHRVRFLDASELLTVRMFESLPDAWTGGGDRSPCPASSPGVVSWSTWPSSCSLRCCRSLASSCDEVT
jgi:dolichol-phosphate mannosyltransferase